MDITRERARELSNRAKWMAKDVPPEASCSGYDNYEEGYLEGIAQAFSWLAGGQPDEVLEKVLAS